MTHPIVLEARSWIGTPYVHQASCKGAGTDCLGLLRGVWRAVLGAEPEAPPGYSMDWGEAPDQPLLLQAAQRHLLPKALDEMAEGDVLLFQMRDDAAPKHLGIQSTTDPACFIHAYSRHGVCETHLSLPWRRRVIARFQFPTQ